LYHFGNSESSYSHLACPGPYEPLLFAVNESPKKITPIMTTNTATMSQFGIYSYINPYMTYIMK